MTVGFDKREKGLRAWKKGINSERWVVFLLRLKGYEILKTRYRTPLGEIDIIAETKNALVFVEVKARASHEEALHALSVTQRARLVQAAESFLSTFPTSKEVRFDLFLVKPRGFPVHLKNVIWRDT